MIRDRQTSANVNQWRKVLSEPTLIMRNNNITNEKKKLEWKSKREKITDEKKSSLFYREKIELVLRWLRIYFNSATVHWFEQILCEEQHRQRYNRCAQCIDNENIGYDLAVREKRPTVAHKLTIPRAKFIRRPLWPDQRCAYAHQVHRPTSLTRAPIHTSNTPPRKGRFRTLSEIIIFFFFFLLVHRGNTFRSSNVDIRFSRPRLHCRTVAHAWISLMGMTRGATAFANTITARQLSLVAYGKGRHSFNALSTFLGNESGTRTFSSNKNL